MGKFWSMLGTDDQLVYAVMIAIGVAFVLEAIKVRSEEHTSELQSH